MLATDPASGAINMALLDLCGKQAKVPVYQLLGGPTRNKVRALTLFDERALATGHRAFVVPISLPQQNTSRPRFVDSVVKRFEALRRAHGEDVDFVADGMGLLPSAEAADIAVALEALHPLWFDQPCRASNSEVLARLTTEFATPVGLGRDFEQVGPLLNLLRHGLIDVVRLPLARLGITPIRRAAAVGPIGAAALADVGSKVRITAIKTFGVTLPIAEQIDRPYVFVKIETNQGVYDWGEGTLEAKAAATLACIEDFREFLIGADPMPVEHHWQSMYVHSFYRVDPVIGSALSAIDQALWDICGKILKLPVYKLLGGPYDPAGVHGYYRVNANTPGQMREVRAKAKQLGVTAVKGGIPGYFEWIETHAAISRAVKHVETMRANLGDEIDIGIDFHATTSPSVASILCREMEPMKLLFIEEPCPPENVKAMQRIAGRSRVPIDTGERLVASYSCRELVELGIVDIIQPDINHVGGITALWNTAALTDASGVKMAPHACEGQIGGMATIHVDAAMPNFLIQEICSGVEPGGKEKIWADRFGFPAMRMVNGKFPLPTKPGLGFDLEEKQITRFPFAGTKPMARVFHRDGSVAAW